MKKIRAKLVVTLILVLSLIAPVIYADDVHFTGFSAVDGDEIRWGGSTKYSSELTTAISNWNELGKISIEKDKLSTYQDLTFSDVYKPSASWDSLYTPSVGSHDIEFNTYLMDKSNYSEDIIKGIITHELGHALGIGDHYSNIYEYNTVMYGYTFDEDGTTSLRPANIGNHDKTDYNSLY